MTGTHAVHESPTERDDVRMEERVACIRDACPLCALGHELIYSWQLRERRPRLGAWAGLGHQTTGDVEACRAARIWMRHAAAGAHALGTSVGSFQAALAAVEFQDHERALGGPPACIRFGERAGR